MSLFLLLFDSNLAAIAVCNEIERLTIKEMTVTSFNERLLYGIDGSFLKYTLKSLTRPCEAMSIP
jgi:hypothetical protein